MSQPGSSSAGGPVPQDPAADASSAGSLPVGAPDPLDPPQQGRVRSRRRERREFVSVMASRVRDAYVRKPFFVDGDTDLVSLCRALSQRGLTDALVRDGGRIGVFTTTNLRDALLRDQPPDRLPVRDVATFDPFCVGIDDELYGAMLLMLRHRIHRVVVREGEAIVGLLSQIDLMAFVASHSHLIALEIAEAVDVAELKTAARQIDDLIADLQDDGVRVEVIGELVGELNRLLFQRLWELLAPEDLRANSCLLVMGSEGRGEQLIKTDQDNALILRDGFVFPGLETITAAFTAGLMDFGYPPCPGGIMLSRPLWCQSLADFKDTLRRWLFASEADGPMNLAIFLDAAAVAGDATLLDEARGHLDFLLQSDAAYFGRFARAVEQFGDGGGWWSRLPGLRGRAGAEIDLKKLGIFPIVHGVRALALEYRVRPLSSIGRIKALVDEGHLDAPLGRDLADALHCLMGLKLSNNLRQLAEGRAPGNTLPLSALGTLDRQALKDSLAIVRGFKQWLGRHYRFDLL